MAVFEYIRRNKKAMGLVFMTLVIFVLTFPTIGEPTDINLDPSYEYAFNYFFDQHIQIGQEIVFSFGPLGFLLFAQPIGHNLAIAALVLPIIHLGLIFSFLYLIEKLYQKAHRNYRMAGAVIVLVIAHLIDLGFTLIFLTAVLLLLQKETGEKKYYVFSIMVTVLALLIKSSFGIISLLIFVSYTILQGIRFKNYREIILIYVGLLLGFILSWFCLYGNLNGIIHYIYGTMELSRGNSSAMTINPTNNWFLLILFIMTFIAIPIYSRNQNAFILYGLFLLALGAGGKYAFSRIDHINFLTNFIFFFYLLVLVFTMREKAIRMMIIMTVSLSLLNLNTTFIGYQGVTHANPILENAGRLPNFQPIAQFQKYQEELEEKSEQNLSVNELHPDALEIIGNETVDTYPWETTFIPANDLVWSPRPVFQSYIAYTPWLDQHNVDFMQSNQAPTFIIWDLSREGEEMGSIDGRYLFNDEPLTIYEMLNRYNIVYRDDQIVLFERTEDHNLGEKEVIRTSTERWGEWMEVPNVPGEGVLRARITPSRALVGNIKRMLYKEHDIYIEYRLEHGETRRYRLVIDNAESGVWINPLVSTIEHRSVPTTPMTVTEIRLLHSDYDFFHQDLEINWEFIEMRNEIPFLDDSFFQHRAHPQEIDILEESDTITYSVDRVNVKEHYIEVRGWAHLEDQDPQNQEVYVVLQSDAGVHVFNTRSAEISDFAHRHPEYDHSGFASIIYSHEIEAGEYSVGILIEKGAQQALQYTPYMIHVY